MGRRITVFALLVILTLALGYLAGCASSGQPHMNAALDELRGARQELDAALADKGGLRRACTYRGHGGQVAGDMVDTFTAPEQSW